MKVSVNYPKQTEDKQLFDEQFALFHALLLFEKVKKLDITVESKKRIISSVINIEKEENK